MHVLKHTNYAIIAFTTMRLTLVLALTLSCLIGCGTQGAPLPPSANIPKAITNLQAIRKGDAVTLSWTAPQQTTDGALVRHSGKMIVRRSTPDNAVPTVIAELPLPKASKSEGPQAESAKDDLTQLLQTSTSDFATYSVEAVNASGKSAGLSNQVAVPLVLTPATPKEIHAEVVSQGISISWNQSWAPQKQTALGAEYAYRIMRRLAGSNQQPVLVKQVDAGNQAIRVIDTGIEWEKQYQYWVTPVTFWHKGDQQKGEVEGDDSPAVTILAHDTFPPAVPSGLQAVFTQGQPPSIDLTWNPNSDSDLAGYNVYRRTDTTQAVKINSDLVKTPAFRDTSVQPGTKYFYSVSAVDLRNNESARSPETSEAVPQ
jgi:fibronectin type 3 domain-containing protein